MTNAIGSKLSRKERKILEREEQERRIINYNRVVAIELANREKPKSCSKDAYIAIQNVNKIYDNLVQAVYDFNLDIKKNEFIVFVGPSGCGKSTTLRMIAGLEEITAGNLFIDGVYANALTPKDRNISMVFQSYALYPHMSVYDNMAFSMKIRKSVVPVLDENGQPVLVEDEATIKALEKQIKEKEVLLSKINTPTVEALKVKIEKLEEVLKTASNKEKIQERIYKIKDRLMWIEDSTKRINEEIAVLKEDIEKAKEIKIPKTETRFLNKDEIREIVLEAAKILQIEEYLDRKPRALSGGQRQRVALGRAICKKSKLFLMDEPLSNLDAKLRVNMRSEIIKLHKRIHATTIYVTHDQTEAMTMADRIVIMDKGYIKQIGTPKEIYNNPANVFVATFIGSPAMNIFDWTIENNKIVLGDKNVINLPESIMEKIRSMLKQRIDSINEFEKHGLQEEFDKELNVKKETYKLSLKESKCNYVHDENGVTYNPLDLIELDDYEEEICQNIFNTKLEELKRNRKFYETCLKNNRFEIKFGVRPEDIYIDGTVNKAEKVVESDVLTLEVSIKELLGNEYYLHTSLLDKDLVLKAKANVDVEEKQEIKVVLDMKKIHIFDTIDKTLLV